MRDVKIEADDRSLAGRRASRKLARKGLIPGVLYGGVDQPVLFQVDPRRLDAILHSESGSNTLFKFSLTGGRSDTLAMIREVQVDPLSGRMIHADLLRISMERAIEVRVPIHLTGTARGVKNQGGILDFVLRDIVVSCLPGDIPERFDADVTELDLGKAVKVSDLKIPSNIKVLTDSTKAIATVVAPAAEKSAETAAADAAAAGPAEPEVIKKGKVEAEGAEPAEGAKSAAAKTAEKAPAAKAPAGKPDKEKGGGKK